MDRIAHDPAAVVAPQGGYTHGVEVRGPGRLLFVSGQTPEGPEGAVADDFDEQCRQSWRNVLAVLGSAGLDASHLVRVTTYLTNRRDADANGRIRREMTAGAPPFALTVIVAQTLQDPWLLEIEAVAADA